MEKLKRYLIFLVGLFVNSLGVSLITKANLGTSPISSIPYVLSLNFPFTLGNFTIFFSIFLIVLQLIILRKNFKLEHILQIPVSIIFGYFIDLTMILFSWVNPEAYVMKIVYLLIGCLILGVGVYMEVLADVVMLPGESFVRAIVLTWKTNFGTTKICFDVSMAVIAAVLSFVFAGRLDGVREGTVIAALLVGGASVDKASIGNVFLGVILFHLMFIVAPRAGAAITGDSMIGEYFRVFVSYAVITVALVMYETNKRKAKRLEGERLKRLQEEESKK